MNYLTISNHVEEPATLVQKIIENRENRIITTGRQAALPKINSVLIKLLPLYGIEAPPEHIMELVDFVCSFKLIGPDEIPIAFEKYAKQELNLNDCKLYGKVDLYAFGRILNAYIDWRHKIYAAADMENEKRREKINEVKKKEDAREKFYREFPAMLKNFAGKSYDDVPVYWYDAALNSGLIEFKQGEKLAIWNEAQEIAKKVKPNADNYIDFKSQLKAIEQGNKDRAVVIAQKIIVWRKVLNKK